MERTFIGLDIGTTKICAIIAAIDNDNINILGIGKAENEGMNRGTVTHIDKTVQAIRKAVHEAEIQSGIGIRAPSLMLLGTRISRLPPPS